jgi:ABC-type cobalamin transport system permease subunit
MNDWLDTFFSGYRWYRRWVGGKWLYVQIMPVPIWIWTRDRPLEDYEVLVDTEN